MESELRKLSQAELRQIRGWLDDLIEDELEFTPEFERSIQQAERDMANGKSARVREPEHDWAGAMRVGGNAARVAGTSAGAWVTKARERGDSGLLCELRRRIFQAVTCCSCTRWSEDWWNRFAARFIPASPAKGIGPFSCTRRRLSDYLYIQLGAKQDSSPRPWASPRDLSRSLIMRDETVFRVTNSPIPRKSVVGSRFLAPPM